MINTSLLQLAGTFLLGVMVGTLVSLYCAVPAELNNIQNGPSLASVLWLPLLAFLLGTSVLGHWMIPPLMILRGYMLAASFAFLIRGGFALENAIALTVLPALFSVPAFFLLCEEAVSSSRILRLCSESGLTRSCSYIGPLRLTVIVLLLLTAAAVQIYLLPKIV